MIRTILMLIFWALAAPIAAIIGFTASFIMGDVRCMYRLSCRGAWRRVDHACASKPSDIDQFDHSAAKHLQ